MGMEVITTENKPIKCWATNLEGPALEQAKNLANLPFIHRHVALMPDCHMGYGMPIGGVIATKGVVIPNAVGVDIGCGMVAQKTNIKDITTGQLKEVMSDIRRLIPVGFSRREEKLSDEIMPDLDVNDSTPVVLREYEYAKTQLGTLGGGNHFIEIQKDEDGYIWVMIHSGSRNLGYKVAKHYNDLAKELNQKWFSDVPKDWELAFLPLGTRGADLYINEMNYCLEFALLNRREMMMYCTEVLEDMFGDFDMSKPINIHHNYAAMENHGDNVMVHRKGATRARKGELGIIPGSQGTKSYIVRGLGNKASFESCSHGAGRKMGRKAAIRDLDLAKEQAALDAQGIIHSVRDKDSLDEAPSAYKDIQEVMSNQSDLVEIVHELTPLGVIKG